MQFRINQLPIERIVPNADRYKKNQYKEKFLEALCDRKEYTTDMMKNDYEAFQRRLDESRKGG